jgi:hypothetical protein
MRKSLVFQADDYFFIDLSTERLTNQPTNQQANKQTNKPK